MNETLYEKICQENQYDYGHKKNHLQVLAEKLYADDMHFIYEILQNAEDAGAKHIYFDLSKTQLAIYHDGIPFTEANVRAITQIDESTKVDTTKIGKFGIGFKSVYAITDMPEVHSDNYHFHIKNYILPEAIKAANTEPPQTTYFCLPFKEDQAAEIYEKLSKRLENMEATDILFLHSLEEVTYKNGEYEVIHKREQTQAEGAIPQITISDGTKAATFLIFSKKSSDKKIDLAFAYDLQKRQIQTERNTLLFVWFPTEKETNLHFLLNGNFVTTASRENIPENNKHNKALLDLAAELLAEALPQMKAAGLCNLSFLQTLPIEANNFPEASFFYPLFAKVQEILTQDEYLPTVKQSFTSADKAVIARSAEITKLYTPEGKNWLSTAITSDRTPTLLIYLEDNLGIDTITPEDFARGIDKSFLAKQTDDWFIRFYRFLDRQKALWSIRKTYTRGIWQQENGILRTKPIIRLQNDSLCLPEEAFLPIKTSIAYPMVKQPLTENEEALAFLKSVGLREPDAVDYIIKAILPKYRQFPNVNEESYKQDLQHILGVLNGDSVDASSKLKEQLSDLKLIKCEDGIFRKAEEVYCPSELLKLWFKYSYGIHFAGNVLSVEDWEKLGVRNSPKIAKRPYYGNTLIIEGMEDFLKYIKIDTNILILQKILLDRYHKNSVWITEDIVSVNNNNYQNAIRYFLLQTDWVLGKDGQFYKPADITKDDIAESVKSLASLPLEFKTNHEKELEEELARQGKMIVDIGSYKEFEAWKERQKQQNPQPKNAEQPIELPFIDNVYPEEIPLSPIPAYIYKGGTRQKSAAAAEENIIQESANSLSPDHKKALGERGEEIVKKYLIEHEYCKEDEIRILNTDTEEGTGRDIEVFSNGEKIKIIEVKSTTNTDDTAFRISGKQWEVARKEGNLYWIYAVFGVNTTEPKIAPIQNPVQKWADGELQAAPVKLIIRHE